MVQELHVLRCFSCETFQSHIVKKINKWECKVCGIKQSVKKVYGRGSGKDCRFHTQKLNRLRSQKDETRSPYQNKEEVSEGELPVRQIPTNDNPSANPDYAFKTTSKWAEFVDEKETSVIKNYCTKSEKSDVTPTNYTSESQKRKPRDCEEVEGYSFDLNSIDENYFMLSNNYAPYNSKKIKLNKSNVTKNNSNKIKEVDNVYDTQGIYMKSVELVNKPNLKNNLKPKSYDKLNGKGVGWKNPDVSLKWTKYLVEEEDLSSKESPSMNTCINNQLESETITNIKYYEDSHQEGRDGEFSRIATQEHLRKISSDCEIISLNNFEVRSSNEEVGQVTTPFEKILSNHFVSSSNTVKNLNSNFNQSLFSRKHSFYTLRQKSCSDTNSNSFLFDSNNFKICTPKEVVLKKEINEEVVNKDKKNSSQEENLNPETISLPVFEQNGKLSDSDFELDF